MNGKIPMSKINGKYHYDSLGKTNIFIQNLIYTQGLLCLPSISTLDSLKQLFARFPNGNVGERSFVRGYRFPQDAYISRILARNQSESQEQ